ncbi:MAG: hypothetical protein AAF446_01550 [Pseudomonadota bacterium]
MPTVLGDFSDQIVITSNATSNPDTVRLSGRSNFELLVVPTLNGWGLLILTMLLFGIGGLLIRIKATR